MVCTEPEKGTESLQALCKMEYCAYNVLWRGLKLDSVQDRKMACALSDEARVVTSKHCSQHKAVEEWRQILLPAGLICLLKLKPNNTMPCHHCNERQTARAIRTLHVLRPASALHFTCSKIQRKQSQLDPCCQAYQMTRLACISKLIAALGQCTFTTEHLLQAL